MKSLSLRVGLYSRHAYFADLTATQAGSVRHNRGLETAFATAEVPAFWLIDIGKVAESHRVT